MSACAPQKSTSTTGALLVFANSLANEVATTDVPTPPFDEQNDHNIRHHPKPDAHVRETNWGKKKVRTVPLHP